MFICKYEWIPGRSLEGRSFPKVLVPQLCPTLCDPMNCSPPGSSIYAISQARILEWVAISSSRGFFQPRDWTSTSCLAGGFFTTEPPGKTYGNIENNKFWWIKKVSCERGFSGAGVRVEGTEEEPSAKGTTWAKTQTFGNSGCVWEHQDLES